MKLREYQKQIIADVQEAYRKGNKQIVVTSPTGSGKSYTFAVIAKRAIARGNRVLVVTDRIELHSQTSGAFADIGVIPSELTASTKEIPTTSCTVAMSETLKRRLAKDDYMTFLQSFNVIIIDEAHKQSFDKIFAHLLPHQYVLGFTATPIRVGRMTPLSKYYKSIVYGPSISYLIKHGFLAKPVTYGVPIKGLNDVKQTGGDFDHYEMGKLYDNAELYEGVVSNWKRLTPDTKTLVFSSTVANSKKLSAEFGDIAVHLDANTPSEQRKDILRRFKNGDIKVVCNVGILTTGFDDPSIETIVLYRATRSVPLFLQCCGRGSRVTDTKDSFNILDFGENVGRLGFWEEEREYDLNIKRRPSKKADLGSFKECDNCGALVPISVSICTHCQHTIVPPKSAKEVELEQLEQKFVKGTLMTIPELINLAKLKKYSPMWVAHQLNTLDELKEFARIKGYKPGWVWMNKEKFLNQKTQTVGYGYRI